MNTLKKAIAGVALVAAGYAPVAGAVPLEFDLNNILNSGLPTDNNVIASFENGLAGHVTLSMSLTSLLSTSDWLSQFYFNSNVNPSLLTITPASGTPPVTISQANWNLYSPGGDGNFDVLFQYSSAQADRFKNQTMATYDIYATTVPALTKENFNSLSGATSAPFYAAAAKVSGVWTTTAPVPEPETYAMMLVGLGLMGLMARRRRQSLQPDPA